MSLYLQAPANLIQTTVRLPSPKFQDGRGLELVVNKKRSINGTLQTHVKSSNDYRLEYEWNLFRDKAFELYAFIEVYVGEYIRVTDHNWDVWKVKLITEPFQMSPISKDHNTTIRLEFIGEKIG